MAFEIHQDVELVRRRYNPERAAEVQEMFRQLAEGEGLKAKIDMPLSNVRKYAKKLGISVRTSKIDNLNCYVWLKEEQL